MREELLKGLSDEQIKKVEACKSSEEVLNLAKAEGMELTYEQLEAVSGGGCHNRPITKCPECGSTDINENHWTQEHCYLHIYECRKCGHYWEVEQPHD